MKLFKIKEKHHNLIDDLFHTDKANFYKKSKMSSEEWVDLGFPIDKLYSEDVDEKSNCIQLDVMEHEWKTTPPTKEDILNSFDRFLRGKYDDKFKNDEIFFAFHEAVNHICFIELNDIKMYNSMILNHILFMLKSLEKSNNTITIKELIRTLIRVNND